ncbi:prephenate dehydratase [Pseudovibrio brasiliensis]|uniref:Prephenate dehydratase n=1 Tax=Pseudovibrio brasiliensis TaxID=1898042 RepID=A0ABX8AU56_9HYPH|nr:prephenate dehydratase [Pseudovibrio brasiliensis]QUS58593.1 prephenate dehydratase [Pseudovibrio brasiliensis]
MDAHLETPEYLAKGTAPLSFDWVRQVHTLGPTGTNCERAALRWAARHCKNAEVFLHATMELAAEAVAKCRKSVLLSVVAYPHLHSIIYQHIGELKLMDVFIMNTDDMVLASSTGETPKLCATHPAPEKLIPASIERKFVTSNAQAAAVCAKGEADGCITTLCAANEFSLTILRKHGPVPMGFTIHGPLQATPASHPSFTSEFQNPNRREFHDTESL